VSDTPNLTANHIDFSFVTLTSTGYGDIVPMHPIARSLANLEAIIGQLYPATLLARLSLSSSKAAPGGAKTAGSNGRPPGDRAPTRSIHSPADGPALIDVACRESAAGQYQDIKISSSGGASSHRMP
jgi:hypothetical protein